MKATPPPNSSSSDAERLEETQCPPAKTSAPKNAQLFTAKSARTRQVPLLSKASVAFHEGITKNQEYFSLKSAAQRLKKNTNQ